MTEKELVFKKTIEQTEMSDTFAIDNSDIFYYITELVLYVESFSTDIRALMYKKIKKAHHFNKTSADLLTKIKTLINTPTFTLIK